MNTESVKSNSTVCININSELFRLIEKKSKNFKLHREGKGEEKGKK